MKKLTNFTRKLWNDESGQGTAEYVLLIAIVVGVLIMFGPQIKKTMTAKVTEVTESISGFKSE